MEDTLFVLRAMIDRGRRSIRNRAIGLYAAAVVVLAILVASQGVDFYRSGPVVLVGILASGGAGFHLWYRSMAWERHPVLLALTGAPGDIVAAPLADALQQHCPSCTLEGFPT